MSLSEKSSVISSNLKPVNVFYVWYGELCRRLNTSPLSIVKPAKPKCQTVLDFVADRIKTEEWAPILTALRLDASLHALAIRSRVVEYTFLHDVDTEEKARQMKRKCGSLWTDYVLKSLSKSMFSLIKRTPVLSNLELDGLPLTGEYLMTIIEALQKNKTIKYLSFKHCPIRDNGCQHLCTSLKYMPNVEVLNLSSCNLTSISAQLLSKVIKYQQINRYCESWHNSLRYEDPQVGAMAGLKRITLNNNRNIGDEGLRFILDELDDDLWIKAIDMQKCGITENISSRLLDTIDYSRSLEVADFRNNEQLTYNTVEKIFSILKKKCQVGFEPEFHWCATATTITDAFSTNGSSTNTTANRVQKSQSAPFKQTRRMECNSILSAPLKRTKTFAVIPRKTVTNSQKSVNPAADQAMQKVKELNAQLKTEKMKRLQIEKANLQLQKKLDEIQNIGKLKSAEQLEAREKLSKFIKIMEDLGLSDTNYNLPKIQEVMKGKIVNGSTDAMHNVSAAVVDNHNLSADNKNVPKRNVKKKVKIAKQVKNGFVEKVIESEKSVAQNLFENFFNKEVNDDDEEDEEAIFVNYGYDTEPENNRDVIIRRSSSCDNGTLLSPSNASLEKFMVEIRNARDDLKNETKSSSSGASSTHTVVAQGRSRERSTSNNFREIFLKVR